MAKMGKKKPKPLNKTTKREENKLTNETKLVGKITKAKLAVKDLSAAKKRVSLMKDLATTTNDLVDLKVNMQLRSANNLSKDTLSPPQPKQKQKKRQKTQIDDTKILMKIIKKK